jgi:hypothetical protein
MDGRFLAHGTGFFELIGGIFLRNFDVLDSVLYGDVHQFVRAVLAYPFLLCKIIVLRFDRFQGTDPALRDRDAPKLGILLGVLLENHAPCILAGYSKHDRILFNLRLLIIGKTRCSQRNNNQTYAKYFHRRFPPARGAVTMP